MAAAAAVLATSGHENKECAIAADTAYSFTDIASILSEITGKKISYLNPDKGSYIEQLVEAGVPKDNAAFFAGFGEAISRNELSTM